MALETHNNDLNRGRTEFVQHLAYSESSHWRKGAARHTIDMVWLWLAYPSRREGGTKYK